MHSPHLKGFHNALLRFTTRLITANAEIHVTLANKQKLNHVKLPRGYTTSFGVFGFLGRHVKAL